MSDTLEFELVSPQRLVKSQLVEMVVVPGAEGDLGVLSGHSPLIAEVRPGVIDIHDNGKVSERIFIAGGFCEISPERCTVLAEEAFFISDIDKTAAEQRLKSANQGEDSNEQRIAEAMVAAAAS